MLTAKRTQVGVFERDSIIFLLTKWLLKKILELA
jgi:hypothetical protein